MMLSLAHILAAVTCTAGLLALGCGSSNGPDTPGRDAAVDDVPIVPHAEAGLHDASAADGGHADAPGVVTGRDARAADVGTDGLALREDAADSASRPKVDASEWCGGGGAAGQCGRSSTIAPYPGVTPVQIDTGPADGLLVASDEKHIMVQRTEVTTGTYAFQQGALDVVTIGTSGVGTSRPLTTATWLDNGFPEAAFTSDGTMLYFVDASTTPWRLVSGSSDGTSLRTIATGTVQNTIVQGTTLAYILDAADESGAQSIFAVSLPGGSPVELVASSQDNPSFTLNATGTAVIVVNAGIESFSLIRTATGVATPLPAATLAAQFSPDGSHVVYWSEPSSSSGFTVQLMASDGTESATIATGAVSYPVFSPDGKTIAWGTASAFTVRTVSSAATATLTVPAGHTWSEATYSADGALLLIGSLDSELAAAPVASDGSFTILATDMVSQDVEIPPFPIALTPAHDEIAVTVPSRQVSVRKTTGGTAQTLSVPVDDPPFFEGVPSTPELLAFTSTNVTEDGIPGSIVLFPTNGSGSGIVLPGTVLPAITESQVWHELSGYGFVGWQGGDSGSGQIAEPFTWGWFGSEVLYETDRSTTEPAFDVVAATDTGGIVGVIAPGAWVWAVRNIGLPTHAFFTRYSENGIWSTTVPQTPGR
jgi:WD40-like Beta Propeller Repeat